MGAATEDDEARRSFLRLYDTALPHVYGYLLRRCGSTSVAEDLTSETFIAAVGAESRRTGQELSTAWLITVARNKLVDHWRRAERDGRLADRVDLAPATELDRWDELLDAVVAHEVLRALAPQHRSALTLRYCDDLPVAEVARRLGRTTGATEVLLVRAKQAFRASYQSRQRPKEAGR